MGQFGNTSACFDPKQGQSLQIKSFHLLQPPLTLSFSSSAPATNPAHPFWNKGQLGQSSIHTTVPRHDVGAVGGNELNTHFREIFFVNKLVLRSPLVGLTYYSVVFL